MRRLFSLVCAAAAMTLAGCHTCDVCDDCGDCNGGYHARHHGDPGFGPGYAAPPYEGTVSSSAKRIPMQPLASTAKPLSTTPRMQAAKSNPERVVR